MLRIPGVKIFSDGGSCNRMAFSFEPPDGGGPGDVFLETQALAEAIVEVQAAGYQAAIHALGDRAVETTLDAIDQALDGAANEFRHRIDHNVFIRPELLSRYGDIGVVPVAIGSLRVCDLVDQRGGVSQFGE